MELYIIYLLCGHALLVNSLSGAPLYSHSFQTRALISSSLTVTYKHTIKDVHAHANAHAQARRSHNRISDGKSVLKCDLQERHVIAESQYEDWDCYIQGLAKSKGEISLITVCLDGPIVSME